MLRPKDLNQESKKLRLCYAIGYLRGEGDSNPQQYTSEDVLAILKAIEKSAGAGTPSGGKRYAAKEETPAVGQPGNLSN